MKKLDSDLIIAKQRACQAKGQNFYVTKTGIKRDYDLLNGSYIYKVYFNTKINVEDSKGKKIESKGSQKGETKVSSKLRDTTSKKVDKDDESKQSELSTN